MTTRERCEITFSVASYEVDFAQRLSLFALLNRFQDLAGLHAEHLQVGYELLRSSNLAWLLSRIRVDILSLPKWGDTVQLATWPKGVDRLFAMRDFALTTGTGDPLVKATSAWLLVDIERGRPQRVEGLPVDLRFRDAPHAIRETPEKIQMPEGLKIVAERPAWLSEIDTNQHVNNAQYAKWIGDCFSRSQFDNHRLTSIQINYLEETLPGDLVSLLMSPEHEGSGEFFLTGTSRNKKSRVFQAQVKWE
jgi:medium-chain acyl-[acyl-carrier-protein] hydrolase